MPPTVNPTTRHIGCRADHQHEQLSGVEHLDVGRRPATLAVIDMNGRIIDSGPNVMRAVWEVAIAAYRNSLMRTGHLRVLSQPD